MKYIEDFHQEALMNWAKLTRLSRLKLPLLNDSRLNEYMFAIPNGGRRNAKEAARLKKQGVLAGVPDLMLPIPSNGFHGLFIELKRPKHGTSPKGVVSKNQKEMLSKLSVCGYKSIVAYGWLDAKHAIVEYLKL